MSGVVRLHDGGILAKIAAFSSFWGRIINTNGIRKDPQFPALVLAAGQAARMGRFKQLLPLPGGGSLLSHAVSQARLLSSNTWVVAGAGYPLIRYRCHCSPSRWLYNAHWSEGLSSSLIAGIRRMPGEALGVFVLLADQPMLAEGGLERLARRARQSPGIPWAACYGCRVGVPAWLPRHVWPEVLALRGDVGAGLVLNRSGARPVDIAGVHQDIDTPEDWESAVRRLAEQAG
nr:nucleotidyltransferase family protein [Marinobacter daepoensis]